MKKLYIILFSITLIACSTNETSNDSSGDSTEPAQWLSYTGQEDKPHIVFIAGDEEYRSEEALPQLAKILNQHHGFNTTVLFSQNPVFPGVIDPNFSNNIPGLEQLASADLMVIFTRFRALPDSQMVFIENYLMGGKPVIGIRTATHAFNYPKEMESAYKHFGNYYNGEDQWKGGFGRLVLGEKWISHHGRHGAQSTRGIIPTGVQDHEILKGIEEGNVWGPTDVYGVRLPLPDDSEPVLLGQVVDREGELDENDPFLGMNSTDQQLPGKEWRKSNDTDSVEFDRNNPMMPIAWTKTYQLEGGQAGRAFTSTIGSSTDLYSEGTRRLLVNASFWCMNLEVPERANVSLVDDYKPSKFGFYDDDYWKKKNLKISDL